jgi:hypothetical protein
MRTQPNALLLADELELRSPRGVLTESMAAAELRRLYTVNQDMLKALKECCNAIQGGQPFEKYDIRGAGYQQCFGAAFVEYLSAVIAKATGETK